MKKLLYFVGVLAIMIGSGEVQGAKKKKHSPFFSSVVSLSSVQSFFPSVLNEINLFFNKPKDIVLASDLQEPAQKKKKGKKKQKKGIIGMLANAGTTVVNAPMAAWQSKMARRLIKKTKNFSNNFLAIGPNTMRYASSEQGQSHIKSALKSGLYYGIHYVMPVAGVIGGVKYLDMRNQRRYEQLRTHVDGIFNSIQEMQGQNNESLQAVEQSQQEIKRDLNGIRSDVSNLRDGTQDALSDITNNFSNLYSYPKDEKKAETNTEIESLEEARSYFAKNVNPERDIQAILGSQDFKVSTSKQVIGKNSQNYRGVSVEVTAQTYDDPKAWVQRGNYTYQNTLKKYQKKINCAEKMFKNTCLDLWYRNEKGESVSLYSSGKDEVVDE